MPADDTAAETSHMDRLTQTQDAIDQLVKIMYSTLSYLTRKANFKQVNPDIPITQVIPDSEPPEVFAANQRELVQDFLIKAKELEYLISVLPVPEGSNSGRISEDLLNRDEQEFRDLQKELGEVNVEYLAALGVAEELHEKLSASLTTVLDSRAALPL